MRLALAIALAAPSIAIAQEPEVPLWGGLSRGDRPTVVAEKLGALPEVKRVKVKPAKKAGSEPQVDINLNDGGLKIFGEQFTIGAGFKDGGLQIVRLTSDLSCRNTAFSTYERIISTLLEKYPLLVNEAFAPKTKSDWLQAEINELNGLRGVTRTALSDGKTTVYLTVDMARIPRPTTSYSVNATARALNNLSWTIYNSQVQACGGTGDRRAIFNLTYFAASEFEAIVNQAKQEVEDDSEAAKARL